MFSKHVLRSSLFFIFTFISAISPLPASLNLLQPSLQASFSYKQLKILATEHQGLDVKRQVQYHRRHYRMADDIDREAS